MFTRIVVGTDGGPEARDAVALGAVIATATGAGLTLLSAFPPYPVSGAGMDRKSQVRAAERQLIAERREFAPNAHIEAVADPDAARALLTNAQLWHADLIVIGSSRRAAAGRCAIGQTGRRLLGRTPPALAIARRGLHELGTLGIWEIAVGYDGGSESERALTLADALANATDAELVIHTVNRDPIPTLQRADSITPEMVHEIREGVRLGAMRTAKQAAAKASARSYVNPSIGDPALVLRGFSDRVDITVIGSRRWGPLARVVLGGVGEALAVDCGSSLMIAGTSAMRHGSLHESHDADPPTTPTSSPSASDTIAL